MIFLPAFVINETQMKFMFKRGQVEEKLEPRIT